MITKEKQDRFETCVLLGSGGYANSLYEQRIINLVKFYNKYIKVNKTLSLGFFLFIIKFTERMLKENGKAPLGINFNHIVCLYNKCKVTDEDIDWNFFSKTEKRIIKGFRNGDKYIKKITNTQLI